MRPISLLTACVMSLATAAWVNTKGPPVTAHAGGENDVVDITVSAKASAAAVGARRPGHSIDPRPDCPHPFPRRRPVDLVICLDTSGSMSGLIDSARAKLWDIVNEIAEAEPTPRLRVGLFTYGSPHVSTRAQGWVVRQLDLTEDLDMVYSRLMALTTNGGEEYVGWVLNDAVQTMSWSNEPDAVRLIFVAGNESADQAAAYFNFRTVAEAARCRRIIINAIYAGPRERGIAEHWDQVARYGKGRFAAIDMQYGTEQIATPQDKILIKLNAELNATYVPYGRGGARGAANQHRQDSNASALGPHSAASRVAAKGSPVYDNAQWDLIDASKKEDFDIQKVPLEQLPDVMRTMTAKERKRYVERARKTRRAIRKRIREVSKQREQYLGEARSKRNDGKVGLDDAIRATIREQLTSHGHD